MKIYSVTFEYVEQATIPFVPARDEEDAVEAAKLLIGDLKDRISGGVKVTEVEQKKETIN